MASSSLYIVNPRSDFLSYISADVIAAGGFAPGAVMGDLPSTTVAALAPEDFHISLCDENLSAIDFNHPADWIAITGKVNQRKRMAAVADEFRRRGKRVIIGGPLATLSPAELRGHCDIMVTGEAEEIAGEFFAHLRNGNPQEHYIGGQPDLRTSPRPRWDLYPNHRALTGVVQTSRGCPFDCEFCDVIQYAGRKQRHKPIANVLAELDQLYALGYRYTFLADDNFTAYRSRCKELLAAMAWWRRDHPMDFFTQVSIDAARDEELLDMCVDAGVTGVFIGIETPNPESLRETGKRQNLRIDLTQQVKKFIERGICVMGGMIVGFDSDRSDIFQTQFDFAMSSSVPIFTLGALMASETTPLRARIEREGRLITGGPNTQAVPWGSNIQPRHMTMDELQAGLQTLCNKLYSPAAFGERMLMFIENFAKVRGGAPSAQNDDSVLREIDRQALQVAANVRRLGEKEGRMWNRVVAATARRPQAGPYVTRMLFHYAQARFMFERASYWEPRLAA
ncbi:MAG: radical SAM protein [Methylobacteriaceae bacterium]|nr:radical SAM protein [Methylobacteriaceae bacterium]